MYNNHAIKVQKYAQRNANNMADVTLMVVLSIQQNWLSVGDQLKDVRENKEQSRFLWGNKAKTYAYLSANKHKMYADAMAIIRSKKNDDQKAFELMQVFLKVDGLGLPKAGFLCQLMAGLVGCMDVHNIRLYGLDPKTLALAKNPKSQKGIDTNNAKIKAYIKMCHHYGTEYLWNSWCELLSTKSKKWVDGNHVSEVHYTYLIGK
jgi:hypothetical protein